MINKFDSPFVSRSEQFKLKRTEIFTKTNPVKEKIFNRYELLLLESVDKKNTSFTNKNSLIKADNSGLGCQTCSKPTKPKEVLHTCNICSKTICSRCVRYPEVKELPKDFLKLCRRCNNIVTDKLSEMKWNGSVESNKTFTSHYKEIKNAQNIFEINFPQFKGLIYSLVSLFGEDSENILVNNIDDGKPFYISSSSIADLIKSTIKLHPQTFLRKLESSINNLVSYKTSSAAYTRLMAVIKSHFLNYVKSKRPENQLLERQLTNILDHKKIKRALEESKWSAKLDEEQSKYSSSPTKNSTAPSHDLKASSPTQKIVVVPHKLLISEKSENDSQKDEGEKFKIHRVWGKQ